MLENMTQDVSDTNLYDMVSKVNLVSSNPRKWWKSLYFSKPFEVP